MDIIFKDGQFFSGECEQVARMMLEYHNQKALNHEALDEAVLVVSRPMYDQKQQKRSFSELKDAARFIQNIVQSGQYKSA